MAASANVFTNKYSEWTPGKRYYGGNAVVDELEQYCQSLALQIFNLSWDDRWVNVQPLSGSVANLAVYTGCLSPGDTILAMGLGSGGHLTHGHPLNASGKYFNCIPYEVNDDGLIDYDAILLLAIQHRPQCIVAGFSAYSRTIDRSQFSQIQHILLSEYGHKTLLMADISHIAGLIAGWRGGNPFEYFDIVTTTTHKTLRWPRGALVYYNRTSMGFGSTPKSQHLWNQIDRGVFPGVQWWPFDHVLVAKSLAFEEILESDWKWYIDTVIAHAQLFAKTLGELWRKVITGGTDNHLFMIDVTTQPGMTGKIAEHTLEMIGLSLNKNMIPHDMRSPLDPSGIRIGTPALTTRGLGTSEVIALSHIIDAALKHHTDMVLLDQLSQQVQAICHQFPLPY